MIDSSLFKEMQDSIDKTANLAKLQLQLQQDLIEKIYLQLAPIGDWFKYCITCVTGVTSATDASDKLGK